LVEWSRRILERTVESGDESRKFLRPAHQSPILRTITMHVAS